MPRGWKLSVGLRTAVVICLVQMMLADHEWLVQNMPGEDGGRQDHQHHSPRCCFAHDCLAQDHGNYAFITTLRSPEYLVLVKELHCSVMKTNPGARFLVYGVEGDLEEDVIQQVKDFAEYREIEDLFIPNFRWPRFAKNWFKLRLVGLTEFDAIIVLDSDMIVRGDLTHLFKLPTDFAWSLEAGPGIDFQSGAFIFVRPCNEVSDHMIKLVSDNEKWQFSDSFAEQSFLQWYFRYTGYKLPSMYNAEFEMLLLTKNMTASGAEPLIIHFSVDKPFNVNSSDYRWKYLCHRPRMERLNSASEVNNTDTSLGKQQAAAARENVKLNSPEDGRRSALLNLRHHRKQEGTGLTHFIGKALGAWLD